MLRGVGYPPHFRCGNHLIPRSSMVLKSTVEQHSFLACFLHRKRSILFDSYPLRNLVPCSYYIHLNLSGQVGIQGLFYSRGFLRSKCVAAIRSLANGQWPQIYLGNSCLRGVCPTPFISQSDHIIPPGQLASRKAQTSNLPHPYIQPAVPERCCRQQILGLAEQPRRQKLAF